ncbi:MAG TPA: hypothetical protein LFW20_07410 [Rickettsia endosymbiont of Omalisus fontisbellaquei]|nr:hypothetical protein [Rickettsia endosymbiont of Omalisus fontisbellaquei]
MDTVVKPRYDIELIFRFMQQVILPFL